jgi:glycosyltransferase involved in cell wall biosynthesis
MKELERRGHQVSIVTNDRATHSPNLRGIAYTSVRVLDIILASLKKQRFDAIFASKPSSGLTALLISRRNNIPVIFDQDDLEGLIPSRPCAWSTSAILAKHASKLVVASYFLSLVYRRVRQDVIYLPNAVDLNAFDPSKYGTPHLDTPRLLWVAPENLEDEIEYVVETLKTCPDSRLVVMGKGSERLTRGELKIPPDLLKRIEIKKWVPAEEIPSLYSDCSAALLPFPDTLWYRCKCPTRLFEYIAMELPFVATVGEPAYMAGRLGSGLIAKPHPKDFALRAKDILSHITEMKERAREARLFLAQNQNFTSIGDRLERTLLEIMHR